MKKQIFADKGKTMKAILTVQNFVSDFVVTLWTPLFVGIFLAIVTYALWPRNQAAFDEASRMPLREE
jgi:cytochrome c oxidase cbb3-type subunit 4